MLLNQHPNMLQRSSGWIIVLTDTDFNKFVLKIEWERNKPLDAPSQNKMAAFVFFLCVINH